MFCIPAEWLLRLTNQLFHWNVKSAIIVQDSLRVVSEQNRRDVGENFRGFVILGTPQKIRDDMLQISIQT